MASNVLVIGGAGFIGSFLADKLIEKNYNVTIFDSLDKQVHDKFPSYINKKAKLVIGDVRNYEQLKKEAVIAEIIFNFAAKVGVAQSMYQIKDYLETNQQGTANLMHILANEKHNVKKIILSSSMTVYGEGLYKDINTGETISDINKYMAKKSINGWKNLKKFSAPLATKESFPRNCKSIYAISKKNQEDITINVCSTYNIPYVVLRLFNVYGPRQSLSNPYTGVAAIFLSRIKNNNPPIIFEDGSQIRDFVSVHDIVKACLLVMEKKEADYNIYNVGSGKKTTIKEIADTLIKLSNSSIKPIITFKHRKGDIMNCFADISKISSLGYRPSVNLESGLKELVEWSKKIDSKDKTEIAISELNKKGLLT